MMNIQKIILILCIFFLNLIDYLAAFKKVCYFTNWAQSRPNGAEFYPEDINPSLCTHIIYAFAKIENYTLAHTDKSDIGIDNGPGLYERIMVLKLLNPSLKIMLAVGGWTQGSSGFHTIVKNDDNMEIFAKNSVNYLRKWNFDGLDVDWEFPDIKKSEFTKLLEELRIAFDTESEKSKSHLELSIAVSALKTVIDNSYEIETISQYVDFINLMAYDYYTTWSNKTGFHSALYPKIGDSSAENTLNAEWSVKYWLEKGCPKEKLILGIAFYGRGFKLANPNSTELGALLNGSSKAGFYTKEEGFLSYFEICEIIKKNNLVESYNSELGAPSIVYGSEWIGYENQESVIQKANYIKDNCLGGAMVWTVDFDDFKGKFCNNGDYPLLTILNEVLQDSECTESTKTTIIKKTSNQTTRPNQKLTTQQIINYDEDSVNKKCEGNTLLRSSNGCEYFQICLKGFIDPLATIKCPNKYWFDFYEQTCVINRPTYCNQTQISKSSVASTKLTEKTTEKVTFKSTQKSSTMTTTLEINDESFSEFTDRSSPIRKLTSPTYQSTYKTNFNDNTITKNSQINFDLNFVCPEISGIFPNLNNCRNFWHCSNSIASLKECPGNLVFNNDIKACSWTSDICKNSLINVIVSESSLLNIFPSQMKSSFSCPQENGIFPNENDCKTFWHCSNNIPTLKNCAGNLVFNAQIGICDYKSSCKERSI